MKRLLLLPLFLSFFLDINAQTAFPPQEIRHNSFVAIVDPEDGSTSFLIQVARDEKFIDLVVDGQWIVSGYANDPLHVNSPLRIKNLEPNTTYYYRFSYDTSDPKYGNVESAQTWDPPATPVLHTPNISTNEVTLNWESDDPDVTGFEIWVYGATGCFQGGTMVQDNILTVGPDERTLTYDFVFFDETTYRFSIYALGSKGIYGDPDSKLAMSCVCYEGYNLSTLVEDFNIELDWSESISQLNLSSLYYIDVDGESVPASFFSSSNGGGSSYNQYLNWEWDISGNWEIDHEKYVRNNRVDLIGSGPGTFTVRLVDPCTGAASQPLTYSLKEDQTIDFGSLPTQTFGDSDFTLSATATSGLQVSYSSSDESVATVSGNLVSIVGAGTTTITASQTGNSEFNAAEDVSQTLTVNKGDQGITFYSLDPVKFSDGNITLNAIASSGLTVSYQSSDASIASISGNTVTLNDVGTVTITALQSGDENYNAASNVDQSLTVLKGDQSITFDPVGGPYNVTQNSFSISADASSGLTVSFISSDENVVSISGSTATIEGAGTATISAQQPGNSLYNAASDVSQEVIINKLSQTVTVPDLSGNTYTYGLSASPFQVFNSSGIESMVFESSDESIFNIQDVTNQGSGFFIVTIGIVGAGTATFTATQPGDDTYEPASASAQITVNKSDQLIEFFSLSPVFFDDPDFELSATAESGLPVTFTSTDPSIATVSGTIVMVHNAGETTIIASQSGNENYSAAEDIPQVLTVMKRTQTISFDTDMPGNNVFGDGPFSFSATASSGLPVTITINDENVVTVENDVATILGAGEAIITATQVGNQNYVSKQSTFNVQVEKASQTITFDPLSAKSFGDPAFQLTATTTSGLPITYTSGDESVATINGNMITIVGSGSSLITANQPGNDNYYAAGSKNRTLTVDKADQIITFDPIVNQEVGTTMMLMANSSSELPVSYDVAGPATLNGNELTMDDLGTITVTASQPGNANYNAASEVVRTFDVIESKQEQSITFNALDAKIYGDTPFDLTAIASSALPVVYNSSDESVAVVEDSRVTIVGAGTTTITASQAGNNDFYPADDVAQNLIVNKAEQSVVFDPPSISDQPFSAGSVTLDIYGDPYSEGALSASIKSGPATMVDIGPDFYEVTFTGFGEVVIEVTIQETDNYASSIGELSFQVIDDSKQNQSITFDALEQKSYGDADFELTATSSSGLVVTYISSNESVATISGNVVTIMGAGTSTITASQGGDSDYFSAEDVEQVLVVNKADQVITFDQLEDAIVGDIITLSASASSGLEVSFDVSGPATLDGNQLEATGIGTVSVIATQTGDANHNAATEVTRTLEITEEEVALGLDEQRTLVYPNPVTETLYLQAEKPANIFIYSMNGALVFSRINVKESVDLKSLENGIYVLEVHVEHLIERLRIQKAN